MTKPMLAISLVLMTTSACSFIEPLPGSNRIILSSNLDECETLSEVEFEVQDSFIGLDIRSTAMREELLVLAQNAALQANANAIWPTTQIIDGRQTFKLLDCPKPSNK